MIRKAAFHVACIHHINATRRTTDQAWLPIANGGLQLFRGKPSKKHDRGSKAREVNNRLAEKQCAREIKLAPFLNLGRKRDLACLCLDDVFVARLDRECIS